MIARSGLIVSLMVAALLLGCTQRSDTNSEQSTASPSTAPTATVVAAAVTAAPVPTPAVSTTPGWPAVTFTDIVGIEAEPSIRALAQLGVLDSTSGTFKPLDSIKRRDYIRWLVKANNVYFKGAANRIRLAEGKTSTFVDIPASDPDFKYIQGMADTGYLVGYDKTHFKPDQNLSREEMLTILISRDTGGKRSLNEGPPAFSDGDKVSKVYRAYINADSNDWNPSPGQISRIYGAIKTLRPLDDATRGDAAIALSLIDRTSALTLVK
jgi:hypothetical protein